MTVEKYERKIGMLKEKGRLACTCWDHLRAAGITPIAMNAHKHRSADGKVHDVSNGEVDRDVTRSVNETRSEAERVMVKGRGQND